MKNVYRDLFAFLRRAFQRYMPVLLEALVYGQFFARGDGEPFSQEILASCPHSTAEDINDTIHVIVEYRIAICPINVYKCYLTDTLLPYGAVEVRFQLITLAFPC